MVWISQALGHQPAHAIYLIGHFYLAHVVLKRRLKRQPTPGAALIVELEHQEALAGQILGAHVYGEEPIIGHALRMGAAVHAHNSGEWPLAKAGRRSIDGPVQQHAIAILQRHNFWRGQGKLF